MEESENRVPATAKGLVVSVTEATLRLEVTDLPLDQLRDASVGRLRVRVSPEQSRPIQQTEAALEAYNSYFYPPDRCRCLPEGRRFGVPSPVILALRGNYPRGNIPLGDESNTATEVHWSAPSEQLGI